MGLGLNATRKLTKEGVAKVWNWNWVGVLGWCWLEEYNQIGLGLRLVVCQNQMGLGLKSKIARHQRQWISFGASPWKLLYHWLGGLLPRLELPPLQYPLGTWESCWRTWWGPTPTGAWTHTGLGNWGSKTMIGLGVSSLKLLEHWLGWLLPSSNTFLFNFPLDLMSYWRTWSTLGESITLVIDSLETQPPTGIAPRNLDYSNFRATGSPVVLWLNKPVARV